MSVQSTSKISRPYELPPGRVLNTVMEAIQYSYTAQPLGATWDEVGATLDALNRACRFADASCDCGSDLLNWPHRLQQDGPNGWLAHYQCRECEARYTCWWSDDLD